MEASKRARPETSYSEQRNYRKRIKISSGTARKEAALVNALVLDIGGYNMKIGYSSDPKPSILPNCIMKAKAERKRVFIADQIDDCRDLSGLYYIYPHERGYIGKFDIQKNVWDYTFSKFDIEDKTVMLTQPIFNFRNVQAFTDEIFFEEYDIKSIFKANATDFSYYKYCKEFNVPKTSALVIDAGFSFTHIVPYINGKKFADGIIRLDIGGKFLTNYLKDILSYRQLHVMDETYVINQVKEDVCFTSRNFNADMQRAKTSNDIVKNYVLPDFQNVRRGYIYDDPSVKLPQHTQILRLNNERITIPEVMFRPSIIPGLTFAGLAECVGHSISRCPKEFQKDIASHVLLTGGTTLFPGFRDRLEAEAQMFLDCECELKVYQPNDAANYSWFGGKKLSTDPALRKLCVTLEEYEEGGSNYIHDKFNDYYDHEEEPPKEEPVDEEEFSYLNYWKKEGIDIFQKDPLEPLKDPEIQFKLEGENIEEYDGKFVTLDFEIEKTIDDTNDENLGNDETARYLRRKRLLLSNIQSPNEQTLVQTVPTPKLVPIITSIAHTPSLTTLTTTASSINRTITTLTSLSPQLLSAVGNMTKTGQIVTINPQLLQSRVSSAPNILNSNIVLPKLTRIQPRVIRPVYKSVQPGSTVVSSMHQSKITQFISLGNSVNLSGLSIASTAGTSGKTLVTPNILNNAVIVPQNMLSSKNLTFQIIPIKSDMVRQGNIILTQTKTTKD